MRRSSDILNGAEWANVRALYKSSGFTGAELENPIIAVVTAFNEVCPGHIVLKQLTQRVKEGIYAAGGTPVEIGTIGACDGVAMSHKGCLLYTSITESGICGLRLYGVCIWG